MTFLINSTLLAEELCRKFALKYETKTTSDNSRKLKAFVFGEIQTDMVVCNCV